MTISAVVLKVALLANIIAPLRAQSAEQKKLSFEIASVKPNKSSDRPSSNFPLGPGDVYVRNGGYFSATNQPLILYILFAYKIMGNQIQYLTPQLPEWVTTDRFDIQARAESDPGKEGMRMMMRALLADRFKFAVHMESRDVPVLALFFRSPERPALS